MDMCSLEPHLKPSIKNLGVIMDSHLKLDKCGFFQLRLLLKVKSFLSFNDSERVIRAFISTGL